MNARSLRPFACVFALALLAACQGNVGSSYPSASLPALSPNPGSYVGSNVRVSRSMLGSVTLVADDYELDFPPVDGFGLHVIVREPPPGASPRPTGAAPKSATSPRPVGTGASPVPTASPTPSPTASPAPTASPNPSAAASAASSATPSAEATATPAPAKVEMKLTSYPENAPELPATAGAAPRRALVRAALIPQRDLSLRGASAFEFVLPPAERTADRAFTIAVYEALKRNRLKLIVQDPGAALAGARVRGSAGPSEAPLLLRRGRGYTAILYATEGAPPTGAPGAALSPGPSAAPAAAGASASPGAALQPGASPSAAVPAVRPTG